MKQKKSIEGEELEQIIKQNKDLIDALKNLNERLSSEMTGLHNQDTDFSEAKILTDTIPSE
jgi:hypothetical protein